MDLLWENEFLNVYILSLLSMDKNCRIKIFSWEFPSFSSRVTLRSAYTLNIWYEIGQYNLQYNLLTITTVKWTINPRRLYKNSIYRFHFTHTSVYELLITYFRLCPCIDESNLWFERNHLANFIHSHLGTMK